MVGLVFVDTLHLSPLQWGAVLGNTAGWLYVWHHHARILHAGALLSIGLLYAFWNVSIYTDTAMLFDRAAYLQSFTWGQFLSEVGHQPYVRQQPPFYTFCVSRLPVLWAQQLLVFPVIMLTIYGLYRVYGRLACLVCASPLFALMSTQPSHDMLLFPVLIGVFAALKAQYPTTATLLYGLCWWIKPLILVTLPFMIPKLRGWIVISVGIWAAYYLWACHWYVGWHQLRFLCRQLLLI